MLGENKPVTLHLIVQTQREAEETSMKLDCLCRQDDDQVPSSASVKEALLLAGMGERSVVLPDIFCAKKGSYRL